MHISILVKQYLESIGGLCCKICDKWSDKDTFVGPVCNSCNEEIEEIIAEVESVDW